MADMFGAPVGIAHAQEEQRANQLAGLASLKTMGEIEMQPTELLMKQAQAGYYGALGREASAKAADLEALQRLDANIAAARARGIDLTVADRAAASAPPKPVSAAEPFEDYVRMAQDAGAPLRFIEKAAKTGAEIRQHEASTISAQATAAHQQALLVKEHATRMGALAGWGLQGPDAYDQMRAQAAQEGLDVSHLPANWEDAKPVLRGIQNASMTTKEKAELAIKQASEKAQEKRTAATQAKASAYVALSGARLNLARQEYTDRAKNDGERSASAAEARRSMNARRDELTAAQLRKDFPPIKLDPSAREEGKTYMAADGRTRVLWTKDPSDGKLKAMVLPNQPKTAPGRPASKAAQQDDDEGDDD